MNTMSLDGDKGTACTDPPMANGTEGWHVVVLSDECPFSAIAGNTRYLDSIATALAELDCNLELAVMNGVRRHNIRRRNRPLKQYLGSFSRLHYRNSFCWGGHTWTRNPFHMLYWMRNKLTGWIDVDRDPMGWLPPPNPHKVSWATALIEQLQPEIVIGNYFNSAAIFDRLGPGIVKAIVVHDVMALRARAFEAVGEAFDLRKSVIDEERSAFCKADLCLAIKQEEADYIREIAPQTQVAVVPFTMPLPAIDTGTARPPTFLFVGSNNKPNIDGQAWLLREVWPKVRARRTDARLKIVGQVTTFFEGTVPEGVELSGFVDDLTAVYGGAAVALAPLRFGSGVKVKLIEALAHGLPVVATSVGVEGINPAPPEVLRIADDSDAFAAAMVAALDEAGTPVPRQSARRFAEDHYGPRVVRQALEHAFAPLLGSWPVPTRPLAEAPA